MKNRLLRIAAAVLLIFGCVWSAGGAARAANVSQTLPAGTAAPQATPSLGVIGVVLPTLDAAYYVTLLDRIGDSAAQYGFEIRACAADRAGGELKALEAVTAGGVRSVIIDPSDIGDAGVPALRAQCLAAGVPCVLILDNEEAHEKSAREGNSAAVVMSSKNLGFFMMNQTPDILGGTLDILDGNLLIIASDPDSAWTKKNVAGLHFDSDGTILKRKHIKILKTLYVTDKEPLDALVSAARKKYSKIDTVICIDRGLSLELLGLLQSAGFRGNLLCYTDETTAGQMEAMIDGTRVVYVYWPIAEIAEESFRAAMTQALFAKSYDGSCYLSCMLSKTAE